MSSSNPVPARGVRLHWEDVPAQVRRALERRLGASVVRAVTSPTGFSPGLAARLLLMVAGSFAFGFALVPLYDVFCEVTGIGSRQNLSRTAVMDSSAPADARSIRRRIEESTKTEITGAEGAPLLSGIQVTFVKPDEKA